MKVMVTGGAGYIGSVLIQLLIKRGYEVVCLDRFFFGKESLLETVESPNLELIKEDIRWFEPSLLRGVNAVIDMAALSNDPAAELDPSKTFEINHKGRSRVAKLAKKHGVERYILASSCSVYGFQSGLLDERSEPNPLTTYAKANLMAEKDNLPLADNEFCVSVLRQATVYGPSPRMRFDLAINGMVLGFFKNGKIPIMRDGMQWRPFVHIKDTSKAFIQVLEAPQDMVNKETFNVGSNDQNYQIMPLAKLVADSIGAPFNYEWYGSTDDRSYKVDFSKIARDLGYKADFTPEHGALEVHNALKAGEISDELKTYTVKWYKYLIEAKGLLKDIEYNGTVL